MTPIPDLAIAIMFGLLLGWCLVLTVKCGLLRKRINITDRNISRCLCGIDKLEGKSLYLSTRIAHDDEMHRRRGRNDMTLTLRTVAEALQQISIGMDTVTPNDRTGELKVATWDPPPTTRGN